MHISVTPAASPKEMAEFIRFPLRLYAGDPNFTPHLVLERKEFFSAKNPIFQFTDVIYLLARDEGGNVVGRVTAHVNRRHNEHTGEKTGFFGFFECVEDIEAARPLLESAEAWLRQRGMTHIRGPFNFSTNEECGFLAEGFDTPNVIMMPYTMRYYLDHMAQLGYAPVKDLYAFRYDYQGAIPEYLERIGKRVIERTGVTVRIIDMRRFEEDVARAFEIYNSAWAENWGFVPMTTDEFRYAAKALRPVIDPEVVIIIEKDGEPIAFSLSLPDYNVLLRKAKGRLLPLGWWHLLTGRRCIHRVRVITLGVVKQYRRQGLDVVLYYETFRRGVPRGYFSCEMSWILEDNVLMIRALERFGSVREKTYRLFEKPL